MNASFPKVGRPLSLYGDIGLSALEKIMQSFQTGRDNELIPKNKMKVLVGMVTDLQDSNLVWSFYATYFTDSGVVERYNFDLDYTEEMSAEVWRSSIETKILLHATNQSYSIAITDIMFGAPNIFGLRSFAQPSRSLNSSFQISTTRDAIVNYTVDIAATLSLTTGQAGTVALKYADDSGMTTNVVTVQSSVNGNAGTLAIGLGLTQTATAALSGIIPAGKYVKLVTTNTTGTPTFTMRAAQEVLL